MLVVRMCFLNLVFAAMLAGCASGFKANYDHDPANDFSGYRNFAWISEHPMKLGATSGAPNPLLEPRIMTAIKEAMAAKGYVFTSDAKRADFVLSFTVGSREEIKVDSYPSMSAGYRGGYPSHWGWGGAYYGFGTETSVRQYTKGVLAIDMFDVEERRPVWHGVVTKSISKSDREDVPATIRAAVAAILVGFPPS